MTEGLLELPRDVLLDAIAATYGDTDPERRDECRVRAIEARADAFQRTLAEIRELGGTA